MQNEFLCLNWINKCEKVNSFAVYIALWEIKDWLESTEERRGFGPERSDGKCQLEQRCHHFLLEIS